MDSGAGRYISQDFGCSAHLLLLADRFLLLATELLLL